MIQVHTTLWRKTGDGLTRFPMNGPILLAVETPRIGDWVHVEDEVYRVRAVVWRSDFEDMPPNVTAPQIDLFTPEHWQLQNKIEGREWQ